jgi:hypothetical protein
VESGQTVGAGRPGGRAAPDGGSAFQVVDLPVTTPVPVRVYIRVSSIKLSRTIDEVDYVLGEVGAVVHVGQRGSCEWRAGRGQLGAHRGAGRPGGRAAPGGGSSAKMGSPAGWEFHPRSVPHCCR